MLHVQESSDDDETMSKGNIDDIRRCKKRPCQAAAITGELIRKPGLYSYRIQENFGMGKKLANLANHEPFTKIFLANIHRYMENILWHMH